MAVSGFTCVHCGTYQFPRAGSHFCPAATAPGDYPWCEDKAERDARKERLVRNRGWLAEQATSRMRVRGKADRETKAFDLVVSAIERGDSEAARKWFDAALYEAAASERARARQ